MTTLEQAARLASDALEHVLRCVGFGQATIHWSSSTWVELDNAAEGLLQALSAAPAGFVPVAAFDRLHAHAESLAARLLAAEQATPKAAPGEQLTREQIREVFMTHGFTIKEGQTDLKQYVYDAAYALLELVAAPPEEQQADPNASPSDIAKLRHLYANLKNGGVRDTAQAKRIADGLLAPIIERLEQATPKAAPVTVSDTQHSQFLSDVLTAAGLVTHGKQCKALGERLADMVMRLRTAPQQGAQEPVAWLVTWVGGGHNYVQAHASELPAVDQGRRMAGTVTPLYTAPQPAPAPLIARSLAEWHEEDGYVAWWAWNGREWAGEPAWIGTPNCEDWPGYHTHWTPHPDQPVFSALAAQERQP